jgi:uncharacterized protein YpbB
MFRPSDHQRRMLAMIAQRDRGARELTHVYSVDLAYLSAPICEQYLEQLAEEGYITPIDGRYYIAPKGRDYLQEEATKHASYPSRDGTYTGPKWAVRPGGDDFRRWPSKGPA